jgi:hypothetical protein
VIKEKQIQVKHFNKFIFMSAFEWYLLIVMAMSVGATLEFTEDEDEPFAIQILLFVFFCVGMPVMVGIALSRILKR